MDKYDTLKYSRVKTIRYPCAYGIFCVCYKIPIVYHLGINTFVKRVEEKEERCSPWSIGC
jgi:hypothetical protein